MAKDEPLTAAHHERETRARHTIIRNVEKVRELETGKRPPAATGAKRSAAADAFRESSDRSSRTRRLRVVTLRARFAR